MAVSVTEYIFLPHLLELEVDQNSNDVWIKQNNLIMAYCMGLVR